MKNGPWRTETYLKSHEHFNDFFFQEGILLDVVCLKLSLWDDLTICMHRATQCQSQYFFIFKKMYSTFYQKRKIYSWAWSCVFFVFVRNICLGTKVLNSWQYGKDGELAVLFKVETWICFWSIQTRAFCTIKTTRAYHTRISTSVRKRCCMTAYRIKKKRPNNEDPSTFPAEQACFVKRRNDSLKKTKNKRWSVPQLNETKVTNRATLTITEGKQHMFPQGSEARPSKLCKSSRHARNTKY